MSINNMIRDLMIAKACESVVNADFSNKFEAGREFTFEPILKSVSGRIVVERVLDNLCHIELDNLVKYGPFKVAYVAKGAMADLVCQDKDGDHFYIPSGVLEMIARAERGEFPPEFPEVEAEDDFGEEAESIVAEAIRKAVGGNLH